MEFVFEDVNEAFKELVIGFHERTLPVVEEDSRNGPVLRIPQPVTICFKNPLQRVLLNVERDCNPFFHLYEALWMLAGRNDVESLDYFNSNMKNYSDNGKTFNGAYGFRWRRAPMRSVGRIVENNLDQLEALVQHLYDFPHTRRAVLQMWNVEDDLLKVNDTNDVCCNLSVIFSLRKEMEPPRYHLDMTVTNRSNDLIWGTLGANVVHFSFLQEYMASRLDLMFDKDMRPPVFVGRYYQFTNNLHVYQNEKWQPKKWLRIFLQK